MGTKYGFMNTNKHVRCAHRVQACVPLYERMNNSCQMFIYSKVNIEGWLRGDLKVCVKYGTREENEAK